MYTHTYARRDVCEPDRVLVVRPNSTLQRSGTQSGPKGWNCYNCRNTAQTPGTVPLVGCYYPLPRHSDGTRRLQTATTGYNCCTGSAYVLVYHYVLLFYLHTKTMKISLAVRQLEQEICVQIVRGFWSRRDCVTLYGLESQLGKFQSNRNRCAFIWRILLADPNQWTPSEVCLCVSLLQALSRNSKLFLSITERCHSYFKQRIRQQWRFSFPFGV